MRNIFLRQKFILRLNKYIDKEDFRRGKKSKPQKEYMIGLNVVARMVANARFLKGYKNTIQLQLTRAHILLKPEEYITICIILFGTLSLISFFSTESLLCSIAAGILGWLIPMMILSLKTKRRLKYLNEQLGDAIVLISNSLKAGYSFFQSIDIVVKEMTGPISEEFMLLQKEINLGIATEEALENLVLRVSSDNLELVVTAVMIQRQVGGNLSEVLDNISDTIRERVRIKGEIRTITAQGRLSGLVISVLPLVLGIILYMINPEHISILFKTSLGIAILAFSAIMELIGIYFIRKIVRIEV